MIQNLFHHNKKMYCPFLDLRKAYDTVWKKALYTKLTKLYQVPPSTVNLLRAMHDETKSITRINDTLRHVCNT